MQQSLTGAVIGGIVGFAFFAIMFYASVPLVLESNIGEILSGCVGHGAIIGAIVGSAGSKSNRSP